MDYVTKYYKNLAEELTRKLNVLERILIESATGREAEIERKMRERTEDLLKNRNQRDINYERLRADIEAEMDSKLQQSPLNTPALSGAGQAEASARLSTTGRVYSEPSYSREQRQEIIDREGELAGRMAINDYLAKTEQEKREAGEKEREELYGPVSGGSYENISELSPEERKILDDKLRRDKEESDRRYWENERERQRKEREEREKEKQKSDRDRQETERLRKELERRRREEERLLKELGED